MNEVGHYAFYNCSELLSAVLSEGVKAIGYYAFGGCSNLTSITIPSSVMYIDVNAFNYCTSLNGVIYLGSETEWEELFNYIESGNDDFLNATRKSA